MRAGLIGSGTAVLAATAAAAGGLDAYRWRSRVLVLSTPDAGDGRLGAQRAALASAGSGVRERDIVVLEAVGAGAEARTFRARLGLPATGFRAVLVGKDGGAKLMSDEPIPSEELFSTIDAMPMRREEARERR